MARQVSRLSLRRMPISVRHPPTIWAMTNRFDTRESDIPVPGEFKFGDLVTVRHDHSGPGPKPVFMVQYLVPRVVAARRDAWVPPRTVWEARLVPAHDPVQQESRPELVARWGDGDAAAFSEEHCYASIDRLEHWEPPASE